MAEAPKQFDPEATVAQPLAARDSDATVAGPLMAPEADPEKTVDGPLFKAATGKGEPDPEATDRHTVFDPDATMNPMERATLDPEATVRVPSPGRIRLNPFAPKGMPESIQANLSSLGGLNSLVAIANPVLGAVPQIRRALKHPDPVMLRANLRDQIESFESSAMSAEISEATSNAAVYALCALLDESAAATPWGASWVEKGLLQDMRGEANGGEGFFALLEKASADPDANADLLEFFYVCLTLGFEGRYRKVEDGKQALEQVRNGLYAAIARRRPRPDGLSGHWRSATAEAAAAPAVEVAAKVAAQISAQHAVSPSAGETTMPPVRSFLSRVPRRAVWSVLAAFVGSLLVFYMLALRLQEDESRGLLANKPGTKARTEQVAVAPQSALAAAAPTAAATLAAALAGLPVAVNAAPDPSGRVDIALRHDHQFAAGAALPAPELRPVMQKIAAALDKIPGAIVVSGHADASPTRGVHFASNAELSTARAQSVARLIAAGLSDPKRLSIAGKAESEPLVPDAADEAARARNRRVTIALTPAK